MTLRADIPTAQRAVKDGWPQPPFFTQIHVKNGLTAERIREIVSYNPETGQMTWKEKKRGRTAGGRCGTVSQGYNVLTIARKRYKWSHIAWVYTTGRWPCGIIDHVNGNRSDDRFVNLREATSSQNNANSKIQSNNKSGYKGVHYFPRTDKWVAQLTKNYKKHSLGYYDTPELAYAAYLKGAKKFHGEYATGRGSL